MGDDSRCGFSGCTEGKLCSGGFCVKHYKRLLYHYNKGIQCSADPKCAKGQWKKGVCRRHYSILPHCGIEGCNQKYPCNVHSSKKSCCGYQGCTSEVFCAKRLLCRMHYRQLYKKMKAQF